MPVLGKWGDAFVDDFGLINSLAVYARTNEYGFLESPYRKVEKATVSPWRYKVRVRTCEPWEPSMESPTKCSLTAPKPTVSSVAAHHL